MENNELIIKFMEKKNKVVEAVSYIQKTGRNKHQEYNYVKDEEVIKHIRQALQDVGLVFSAEATNFEVTHEIPTRSGSMRHVKIDLVCSLTDKETGYTQSCKWLGAAADSGDKTLYKAVTSGCKYFFMKNFLIPTGDDVEGDESVDKATQGKAEKTKTKTTTPPKAAPKDTPPAAKTNLTPKKTFWEALRARCENYKVQVPADNNVIVEAIKMLCDSKETQQMTDIMKQTYLPMHNDKPENESWDVLTKVIADYDVRPLIAKAAIICGEANKVA